MTHLGFFLGGVFLCCPTSRRLDRSASPVRYGRYGSSVHLGTGRGVNCRGIVVRKGGGAGYLGAGVCVPFGNADNACWWRKIDRLVAVARECGIDWIGLCGIAEPGLICLCVCVPFICVEGLDAESESLRTPFPLCKYCALRVARSARE